MLSMVVHTCNPNTQDAEAGGSQAAGQLGLHSMILPQREKNKTCLFTACWMPSIVLALDLPRCVYSPRCVGSMFLPQPHTLEKCSLRYSSSGYQTCVHRNNSQKLLKYSPEPCPSENEKTEIKT